MTVSLRVESSRWPMVTVTVGSMVESELSELAGGRSTRNGCSSSMVEEALAVVADEGSSRWH